MGRARPPPPASAPCSPDPARLRVCEWCRGHVPVVLRRTSLRPARSGRLPIGPLPAPGRPASPGFHLRGGRTSPRSPRSGVTRPTADAGRWGCGSGRECWRSPGSSPHASKLLPAYCGGRCSLVKILERPAGQKFTRFQDRRRHRRSGSRMSILTSRPCLHDFVVCSRSHLCLQGSSRAGARG